MSHQIVREMIGDGSAQFLAAHISVDAERGEILDIPGNDAAEPQIAEISVVSPAKRIVVHKAVPAEGFLP